MKKLYVGNLPFSMSNDDLRNLFEQHGSVSSANIIQDRETGRSRGFGFVEMDSDSDASSAIESVNGHDCDGRPLVVNEAKPREERSGGGGGRRGGW